MHLLSNFFPFLSIPCIQLSYTCIFCGFVQLKSTLLILCENGFALQVPAPLPEEHDTASTYQVKNLPTQYFHFYSIKSRIKVKNSPVEELHVLHVPEDKTTLKGFQCLYCIIGFLLSFLKGRPGRVHFVAEFQHLALQVVVCLFK